MSKSPFNNTNTFLSLTSQPFSGETQYYLLHKNSEEDKNDTLTEQALYYCQKLKIPNGQKIQLFNFLTSDPENAFLAMIPKQYCFNILAHNNTFHYFVNERAFEKDGFYSLLEQKDVSKSQKDIMKIKEEQFLLEQNVGKKPAQTNTNDVSDLKTNKL